MSTDSDLKPALEGVAQINENRVPRCEVAAWRGPFGHPRRLAIKGARVWCHWLGPDEYKRLIDPTDYTISH